MKVCNFVFCLGHTESETLACLVFRHGEGFDTVWAGLRSVARVITQFLENQAQASLKDCCRAALEKDPVANFCSRCGNPLESPETDDLDTFFEELFLSRINDVRCYEHFVAAGWDICSVWDDDFDLSKAVLVHKSDQLIATAAFNENVDPYDVAFITVKNSEMRIS